MPKATHLGTCQICGRKQKVSNNKSSLGKLSKHGYTVEWGWFNGVCAGAVELPFEKSCDLVKDSITWSQERAKNLEAKIRAVNAPDYTKIHVNLYISRHELNQDLIRELYGIYGQKRVWREFEVSEVTFDRDTLITEGLRYQTGYNAWNRPMQKVLNDVWVKFLKRQVKEIKRYIVQQQERVDAWVEKELTPIS